MQKTNQTKGIILGLLAPITFGFLPLFSKPMIDMGVPVSSILLFRFVLAAVIMSVYCITRSSELRITKKQLFLLSILAFMYVISGTGLIRSYLYIPSGVATTIHFMYPISVTLIMIYIFRERRSRTIFVALAMAVVGVAMMCWNGEKTLDIRGVAWALSTVFAYTIYIIIVNRTSVCHLSNTCTMFYIFVIGCVFFAASSVLDGGITVPKGNAQWGLLTAMVLLSTIIPNLALVAAIKNAGSVVVSILGCAEPLTAMIIGITYFDEAFTYRTIVGFVLIMVAVTIVIINKNRESKPFIRLKKYFKWQRQKGNI